MLSGEASWGSRPGFFPAPGARPLEWPYYEMVITKWKHPVITGLEVVVALRAATGLLLGRQDGPLEPQVHALVLKLLL
jgi:hypothetical protein